MAEFFGRPASDCRHAFAFETGRVVAFSKLDRTSILFKTTRLAATCGALLVASGLPSTINLNAQDFTVREWKRLLAPQEFSGAVGGEAERAKLLSRLGETRDGDPMWPVYSFIRAENLLAGGSERKAEELYRRIIEHAYSDPQKDTLGRHGPDGVRALSVVEAETGCRKLVA